MPLCSIIIPCYNQADYLRECLISVLKQTFWDWEAIVVDDASTSGNIVPIISSVYDRRIILVRHDRNRGLAAARNTGIRMAQSDYLIPLDADDMLMPDFIDHALKILINNPKLSCAFPDFHFFGTIEGELNYSMQNEIELMRRQWLPGPGILMRKTLWEHTGGYCEEEIFRYGNEDWDFYLSAQEIGFIPIHIPETLYYYRQSQNSLSSRLVFYDYLTRNLMYKRHHLLFDKYKMRDEFLSDGYIHSARAHLGVGDNAKAFSLSLTSLRFHYNRKEAMKLALKSLAPRKIRHTIRKVIEYFSRIKTNYF
jgi:glycosyltransferase involved in cell wall biosynthesis